MVGDSSGSSHDKSGSYGERFTFFPYGVAAVTANYFYTCGDFTQYVVDLLSELAGGNDDERLHSGNFGGDSRQYGQKEC